MAILPWPLLVCVWFASSPVLAQSLGDLARQEAERRRAVAASGKVYTNDDVKGAQAAPAAPVPAGAAAPSAASAQPGQAAPSAAPAPAADTVKKDEAYWRERIAAERTAIDRAKVMVDALQNRVDALMTDFVNRDDPASRAAVSSDRDRALAELAKTKDEIAQRTKTVGAIQEEARRAGVPAAWYR